MKKLFRCIQTLFNHLNNKAFCYLMKKRPHTSILSYHWLFVRHIIYSYKKYDKIFENKIICDYGAGSMPYLSLIYNKIKKYYALDFYQSDQATGKIIKIKLNEDASIPNTFTIKPDVIISNQVLMEIDDLDFYFDEVTKLAKEKTILFLTTPFIQTIGLNDKLRVTPFFLNQKLQKRNFKIITYEPAGYFFSSMVVAFNMALILKNEYCWQTSSAPISRNKTVLFSPLIGLLNIFSLIMDKCFPLKRVPSNFLIIAQKQKGCYGKI